MPCPVLLVEDEATLAKNIRAYLQRFDYNVHVCASGEAALRELPGLAPAAVLLDYNLPGLNGLQLLDRIRARDRNAKVVMVTGFGSERVAVDAMKSGADDYLTKPLELGKLRETLDRLLKDVRAAEPQPARPGGLDRLIGESTTMLALKTRIRQVITAEKQLADSDAPAVLITGETGTGKELVARAMHFDGERSAQPFIEVNCSGIPSNLLEAELFGFERGAFTDAKEHKPGLIEAADGGTLFLDEVGEIEPSAQAKLLKLLEDKQVRRLGSVRERKVNVRIIAATNRDLEQLVREGRFRADLYFRLRIIQIGLPALRERDGDAALLAAHFLEVHRTRYGRPDLQFSSAAMQALQQYDWPGNVRELRNLIEQSVVMATGHTIDAIDLALGTTEAQSVAQPATQEEAHALAPAALNLHRVERDLLVAALERSHGNVSRAARLLGISRDTLRYRIEKYRL